MSLRATLRTLILALACLAALPARAGYYTDIWYNATESGWGVNVVQSDDFMFLTFFIYGADNKPTWYTATLQWDGTKYSGALYLTQGTYWALPWNPADHPAATQVGTASFTPDSLTAYQATLNYTVNGIGSVQKAIERQTLTSIALGGTYTGGQAGSYANCSDSGSNGPYTDTYDLTVTQTTGGVATLSFNYAGGGAVCTLSGPLEQHGQLYRIPGASYKCVPNNANGLNFSTTATVYELKQTSQGIEGRLAATLPSGCQENANFSAVLQ
jgi:hypothetical protein